MRHSALISCLLAAVSLAIPLASFAHSGRTDASGGHNDRKNGGYHYHNGGGGNTTPNVSRRPVQNTYRAPVANTNTYRRTGQTNSRAYSTTPRSGPSTTYRRTSPPARVSGSYRRTPLDTPEVSPKVKVVAFEGEVVAVTDGDTIEVMHNGQVEKIRLYGIDCPEMDQAFGVRAKEFTSRMCAGKEVAVRVLDTDRYGRSVGDVTLPNGESLNRALVRFGLAWWYEKYAPDDFALKRLQVDAMVAKAGLWADSARVAPWDFR